MKLPSLFPVSFFAGGILLSIELKKFALVSPRALVVRLSCFCFSVILLCARIGFYLLLCWRQERGYVLERPRCCSSARPRR